MYNSIEECRETAETMRVKYKLSYSEKDEIYFALSEGSGYASNLSKKLLIILEKEEVLDVCGVLTLNNFGGISIIDYDGEYVFGYENYGKGKSYFRRKVYFDSDNCYFMLFGTKIFFSDIMRVIE